MKDIKSYICESKGLTKKDFKKIPMEDCEPGMQLYWYRAPETWYYDGDGKKKTTIPSINEFYADDRQKSVGGYEIRLNNNLIGSFPTFDIAVDALSDWVSKLQVKGHPKPKWIYNASKGRYQMRYSL